MSIDDGLQRNKDDQPIGTRDSLIAAAEEQFAKWGLTGASLREISRIAGCANTGAVRYHFGDRDGLIAAIFTTRLEHVEKQRACLLAQSAAKDIAPDVQGYLEMLFRPVENQRGRAGHRSYAAFLAGLFHFGDLAIWTTYSGKLPATLAILDGLRQCVPHIAPKRFDQRVVLVSVLVWSGLAALDRKVLGEGCDEETEFQNMLAMAAAAFAQGSN